MIDKACAIHHKIDDDGMNKIYDSNNNNNKDRLIHIESADENEKKIWDKYLFKKIIGKGGFSTVISLHEKDSNRIVAAKVIDKGKISPDTLRLLQEEPAILKNISHSSIIPLIDFVESQKRIFILLEYMEGGDLSKFIKERRKSGTYFKEYEVQQVIYRLLFALQYLHTRGIIHRDVKPGNIISLYR